MNSVAFIKEKELQISSLQSELNTYQRRCEQYAQAYETMRHQLQELLRDRFGKKSERYIDDAEHPQGQLFPQEFTTVKVEDKESVTVPSHRRKKSSKANKDLPIRIEIIPVSDADKQCTCGSQKTVIGFEKKQLMHHVPEVFELIEQQREIVACPKGCEGNIVTAPAPLHILPKVKVTEDFIAFLVTSKLSDRQPLYHLEKKLAQRTMGAGT